VNIPPTNSFDDGNRSGMRLPEQSAANTQSKKGDDAITSIPLSSRILHCNPQASYAIFIDAQNASVNHFHLVQQHITNSLIPPNALPSIRRIYGDASHPAWSKAMIRFGLHSPYNYPDLNIDSLLVMDAMETLYKHRHIQTFILITSDGDFSPLVHKLRESGKIVVGYGPDKSTAPMLVSACHYYFNTFDLVMAKKLEEKNLMEEEKKKKRIDEEKRPDAEKMQEQNKSGLAAISEFCGNLFAAKPLEGGNSVSTEDDGLETNEALVKKTEQGEQPPLSNTSAAPSQKQLSKSATKKILRLVKEAVDTDTRSENGWTLLDNLGKVIDYKPYGYKKLSEFILDLEEVIEMERGEKMVRVRLRKSTSQAGLGEG